MGSRRQERSRSKATGALTEVGVGRSRLRRAMERPLRSAGLSEKSMEERGAPDAMAASAEAAT